MRAALVSAGIVFALLQQPALAGPTTRDATPSCTGFFDCLARAFGAKPAERPRAAKPAQAQVQPAQVPAPDTHDDMARAAPVIVGVGY